MATVISDSNALRQDAPPKAEEALVELEYHALMGVQGGDEPTHVRAFDRDVFGPAARPAHERHGEPSREHQPTL